VEAIDVKHPMGEECELIHKKSTNAKLLTDTVEEKHPIGEGC
jgi:hypothetical protein